ncbi:MAG: hypothetical protein GWP08_18250 [Nitrospiraceae bacterium]|nr:hypothetical protein [Nitrospiraceae bacterium]
MSHTRIVLVAMLLVQATAHAVGTLGIGKATIEGDQLVVPITLDGDVGAGVAALDFTFRYDPNVVQPVGASPEANARLADKQVQTSALTPGEYKVVMMGVNQTVFGSGEVLSITMRRVAGAEGAKLGLAIRKPTLASADGTIIDSAVRPYVEEDIEEPGEPDTPDNEPASDADGRQGAGVKTPDDENDGADPQGVAALGGGGSSAPEAGGEPEEPVGLRLSSAIDEASRVREAIATPGAEAAEEPPGDESGSHEETKPDAGAEASATGSEYAADDEPAAVAVAQRQSGPDTIEHNTDGTSAEKAAAASDDTPAPEQRRSFAVAVLGAALVVGAGLFALRGKLFG